MSQRTPRVRPSAVREAARWVSGGGTTLSGLAVLGVGVASLAQDHGRFSSGVGLVLVFYGALVIGLGVAALRRVPVVRGTVVAAGLLHIIVVASLANSGAPWLWWLEPLLLVTVAAGLVLIPPDRSASSTSA